MPLVPTPAPGSNEIYLSVQTRRAGKIKGEATTPTHEGDIVVVSWNWGVSTTQALGSTVAAGRRAYRALTVVKRIDSATTALLSALSQNDAIKEAKLTMRKSGEGQVDYFSIVLENARVSAVDHATDAQGNTFETVALHFNKVTVDYTVQMSNGGRGATMTFEDDTVGRD